MRLFVILLLVLASALFWFLDTNYPNLYLEKGFYTAISITALYLIKAVLEHSVSKKIKERKSKYSFKKMVYTLYVISLIVVVITIWVQNPEVLFVAYGLVAAGVAISLQDLFKNIAGGIVIFLNKPFWIGDRIELNGKFGDVIDVGVLYTTIMEIKEWIAGDQVTGRIVTIPNGYLLSGNINNYTKDHSFIWDEIRIPLTYNSSWKKAYDMILKIAEKETASTTKLAEREIGKLGQKYYFGKKITKPQIYFELTDNWIMFSLRYITDVRDRRITHNKLSQLILSNIQKTKGVNIASKTIDIVGFPGKKRG